jgi:hypothetical protein
MKFKYRKRYARLERARAEVVVQVAIKELKFDRNDYFVPQSYFAVFEEKDEDFSAETNVVADRLKDLKFCGSIEFVSSNHMDTRINRRDLLFVNTWTWKATRCCSKISDIVTWT